MLANSSPSATNPLHLFSYAGNAVDSPAKQLFISTLKERVRGWFWHLVVARLAVFILLGAEVELRLTTALCRRCNAVTKPQ